MSGLGTSTQSSTEQSQTSYPQWTQNAQANTFSVGRGQLENFLRNPQYSVAGTTTDMLKGYDLARETAQQAYTAPKLQAPGQPNLQAAYGTAAQVTPEQIQGFMSPYMSSVVDSTVNTMGRERDRTAAQIGARAAASGSFGGSREAIQRGQLDRNFGEQVGSTVSQLMAQGYDKATATALANTGFQQQTGMANMAAENAMRTTGADYGLKATQVNDTLRTTNQARQMSALQQLLQGGQMQQQQNQQVLDVPWTALERLFGITPKQMNSQTYSEKESESTASPMSTLTSGISALTGLKGLFGCDRSLKTDIEEIGIDPETGLMMYAFRYKSDPKHYPKVVAPMADEVEAKFPGSTVTIGGKMLVRL